MLHELPSSHALTTRAGALHHHALLSWWTEVTVTPSARLVPPFICPCQVSCHNTKFISNDPDGPYNCTLLEWEIRIHDLFFSNLYIYAVKGTALYKLSHLFLWFRNHLQSNVIKHEKGIQVNRKRDPLHTAAKYTGLWDQEVCRGLEPGREMIWLGWMLGSEIQFVIQGFVKASIETSAIHLYGQMDTG